MSGSGTNATKPDPANRSAERSKADVIRTGQGSASWGAVPPVQPRVRQREGISRAANAGSAMTTTKVVP
jgi:hypothetical protein